MYIGVHSALDRDLGWPSRGLRGATYGQRKSRLQPPWQLGSSRVHNVSPGLYRASEISPGRGIEPGCPLLADSCPSLPAIRFPNRWRKSTTSLHMMRKDACLGGLRWHARSSLRHRLSHSSARARAAADALAVAQMNTHVVVSARGNAGTVLVRFALRLRGHHRAGLAAPRCRPRADETPDRRSTHARHTPHVRRRCGTLRGSTPAGGAARFARVMGTRVVWHDSS